MEKAKKSLSSRLSDTKKRASSSSWGRGYDAHALKSSGSDQERVMLWSGVLRCWVSCEAQATWGHGRNQ